MRTFVVEIVLMAKRHCDHFVSHTLIQYGNVPLGIAAHNGYIKTVLRLLEGGANVNHRNKVMTVNVQLPCI